MAMDSEQQRSAHGPARPSYVFRGHTAQIHSAHITRRNTCLVTGDADGWVVIWKLETKRPLAVWRAHEGAILGTAEWGTGKYITHGRDHALRVWQLDIANTLHCSTVLPADGETTDRPKPWLLHSLPVNTLNFCAFSMCYADLVSKPKCEPESISSVLIAVPARDDKKVEVYRFPDEKLAYVVSRVEPKDTGMVMAVKLVYHQPSRNVVVAVGYEAGMIAVHLLPRVQATEPQATRSPVQLSQIVYLSQPHTQPILSLDASPDGTSFFTSSADAVIATHRIPELPQSLDPGESQYSEDASPPETFEEVSAQLDPASNAPPSDEGRKPTLPSSSNPDLQLSEAPTEVEPLTFSKKPVTPVTSTPTSSLPASKPAGLSSLLSNSAPLPKIKPPPPPIPPITTPQQAYKVTNTKHAGQQSLCVRSDGRLLVTGGWDSRIRLYSSKTMKEMAVLKWHKEGVYAVDFGEILSAEDLLSTGNGEPDQDGDGKQITKRETGLGKLQRQREEQMQMKHWVVAGAKDGKVSLWEVF
ncbi:WD40 repeat-like protein [Massarina eburnea CBS 473.64]|uniref:ASTRA-associated protein 1 n=1 Tax=Massarina eburnea CBS 473.64 TaxID=1395130 RepID=A0A6A6SER5_9PLEO|nr:WD40 repeat-like protein [Massarina eburnea CBS 473.64]